MNVSGHQEKCQADQNAYHPPKSRYWYTILINGTVLNNLKVQTLWFKHILLVNTKGLGVAKLRRKPSPTNSLGGVILLLSYLVLQWNIDSE